MANSGSPATYFSPWFPRGGNKADLTCDVIAAAGLTSLTIQAETKNMDQGDNSALDIGSDTTITMSANTQTTWTAGAELADTGQGMLELMRLKYTVTASSGLGFVHSRMLNPTWLTN